MSWPIPTLEPSKRPEAIKLRIWLLVFVVVMGVGAAAVLLLWPQDRSTNSPTFWLLLVGAPASACVLLFGLMLTQWERRQLVAEESEQEAARLNSLWREWARRHLTVVRTVAFLPTIETAEQLVSGEVDMPVNLQRSIGFYWGGNDKADIRWDRLLGLVVDRFARNLAMLGPVEVVLVLGSASQATQAQWTADARSRLEDAVPGVVQDIRVADSVSCVQWMESSLTADQLPAQLIIAAQIWPDVGEHAFSEGAVALLLGPRVTSRRKVAAQAEGTGRLYRPMTSQSAAMAGDVSMMLSMQVEPRTLSRVWANGLNQEAGNALASALGSAAPNRPVIFQLAATLGIPGPVSGWIAFAIAMEAGRQSKEHQLVAWHEPDGDRTHLNVVAPVQPGGM